MIFFICLNIFINLGYVVHLRPWDAGQMMQDWRDAGLEGYRKRGIQERRVQDIRDVEQERCWTLDRRDTEQVGCRTGGMQDRWDAGLEGCWIGGMQDWRDSGKEGCRTCGM